jgi:hypothetical protein
MLEADRIVQFPFVAPVGPLIRFLKHKHNCPFPQNETEKTEEELARQAEKKREAGRRLQEMAAQKRLEKLLQKENDLEELQSLKDWKFREKKADFGVSSDPYFCIYQP